MDWFYASMNHNLIALEIAKIIIDVKIVKTSSKAVEGKSMVLQKCSFKKYFKEYVTPRKRHCVRVSYRNIKKAANFRCIFK